MGKKLTEDEIKWILSLDATKAQQSIHQLTKDNKELESSNRAIRAEMAKLASQGKSNGQEYDNLRAKLKANTEEISRNTTKIREHEKTLGLENLTAAQLQKRFNSLNRELKNTSRGLEPEKWNRLKQELDQTAVAMGKAGGAAKKTSGIFAGLSKMKAIVLGGFMAIGAYISTQFIQAIRNAYNTIVGFEAANSELAAILQTNKKGIRDLTADAQRLGKATKYTAGEVTGLQTELAKLGFNQKEILAATENVLLFAGATGAELPAAAKLAGSALRAFGLQATQTERVASTMAIATTKSALNFEFLENSLSTVAPVARTFGFTIEETTALLGVLADSGFDASTAATATRNILLNLANDSGKLAIALGRPIKSLDDLAPALVQLRDSGVDLATTLELTDKRSVAAFNTFLQGAEKTTVLRDSITDAGDALKAMSAEKLDTAAGSAKIMESALEGLILRFYESRGIMKLVIDGITGIIDGISWCIGKFTEYRQVMIPLTSALAAYVTVQKISIALHKQQKIAAGESIVLSKTETLVTKISTAAIAAKNTIVGLLTGKVKIATIAQRAWNAATMSFPALAIAALIATVVTALINFAGKASAAEKATKRLNEVKKEFQSNLSAERAQMDYLFQTLKDTNTGTEARKTALKLLNEKYGEYLPSLLTEKSTLEDIEKAQRFANDELIRSLSLKARKTALEETANTYMESYEERYNQFIKRITKGKTQEQKQVVEAQINDILGWIKSTNIEYDDNSKVIRSTNAEYDELTRKVRAFEKANGKNGTETKAWLLSLVSITQQMNKELDAQNKYYDNIAAGVGNLKKKTEGGTGGTGTETNKEISLIKELEKRKKDVQDNWREDTEANIALKNKELEKIDKEIERLKNLGKIKSDQKAETEKEKKKKQEDKEDKKAIDKLNKTNASDIAGEDDLYKRKKIDLDKLLGEQKITEEQHSMMMLSIDAATAEKRLKIAEQYLKDAQSLELHSGDKKVEIVEKANQKVLDAEATLAKSRAAQSKVLERLLPDFKEKFNLTNQEDELNLQLEVLEASYQARKQMAEENGKDITDLTRAYEQAKTNIIRKSEDERLNARSSWGLLTNKEKFNADLQALQAQHQKGLLSEKEYQKARGRLAKQYYIEQAQLYISMASGAINAMQEAEIANMEAKYDAEIAAAQGNSEEVERLETEKAQKKLDIEKKYADVQFAIKISEIIANTSLAIMTAFAQLGPVGGAIAAAMLGATGIMQMAAANAERQKVKNMTLSGTGSSGSAERVVSSGYADGGYTGDGGRYEAAGTVHRGEYVVAVPEMRNPVVFNHVRAIEAFRRQRTTANPLPEHGYANGGYVGTTQQPVTPTDPQVLKLLSGMMDELKYIKETPMKSYTVLSESQAVAELDRRAKEKFTRGK